MYEMIRFGSDKFPVGNNAKRVFCVVLADRSGSMEGQPIDELNRGLETLRECLLRDSIGKTVVDICVVSFGDGEASVVSEWCDASNFFPPHLIASGETPIGSAIAKGLSLIDARLAAAAQKRVACYVPWLILLTDGEPSDMAIADQMAEECKNRMARRALFCLAVGVGHQANLGWLKKLVDSPQKLAGLNFSAFFEFVTRALSERASTRADEPINAQPPSGLFAGA
jgi:uncharacterized protein YegL